MKIEAYKVECCGRIVDHDEATGINPVEDMFDKLLSYPICKVEKTDIHICNDCYKKKVLVPAANLADRKKDEYSYKLKIKELSYGFKSAVMVKYWTRQRKTTNPPVRKNPTKKSSKKV